MSAAMIPYVVATGDFLAALALRHGFDAEAVWSHEKNADLRALRGTPDILQAGDILCFPRAPRPGPHVQARGSNAYRVREATAPVTLSLRQGQALLANEPCLVHGPGAPQHLTTDGRGVLTFRAPLLIATVTLEVPRLSIVRLLRVGHLDPLASASGVRQRLRNLGFAPIDPIALQAPEELAAAIKRFQKAQGIRVTGQLDEATRDALLQAHGC